VAAGSTVHLKIDGITPLAALAIVSGQLNGRPPEAFGRIIVPFEESLDALIAIPEDAEGGTYIFFGQQWEPYGKPAYEGGTLIYPSSVSTVQVRSRVDEEDLWNSFEPWPEEDAEKVRENIRRTRTKF